MIIVVLAAVRFFVKLYGKFAGILPYVKNFLCNMAENMAADRAAKAQPIIMRCCLYFGQGVLRLAPF